MTKYLTAVMIAALTATVMLTAPALADHRPGNVVVMGGSWALTGGYAEVARLWVVGRKLYVEELNARGGLLGHKVELRILDDKSVSAHETMLIHLVWARDRVHRDRGQGIADLLGIEAPGLLHRRLV